MGPMPGAIIRGPGIPMGPPGIGPIQPPIGPRPPIIGPPICAGGQTERRRAPQLLRLRVRGWRPHAPEATTAKAARPPPRTGGIPRIGYGPAGPIGPQPSPIPGPIAPLGLAPA